MSHPIKAVVFDMDGTILDSRELIFSAFEDVLQKRGISITRREIGAITGKPVQAMYKLLAPDYSSAELELEHLAHHEDNLHSLRAYDGVGRLLEILKKRKIKTGIFTGFDQLTYDRLERVGLGGAFDSIVENTRYTAHKPDPEGLYLCMSELGITDSKGVVYVGDGVADMQVGKNAFARMTIGISHGFGTRQDLEQAGADVVVDHLSEISEILDRLGKYGS